MKILLIITTFVNFIALILMGVGSYIILNKEIQPKMRAKLASIMAIFFFLYCFLISLFGVSGGIFKNYLYLGFIIFTILPFIFGHFVRYETIKKYAIYHVLSLILSFGALIYLFFKF